MTVAIGSRHVAVGGFHSWRRLAPPLALIGLVALAIALRGTQAFPSNWNANIRDPIDDFQRWIIDNKQTHPVWEYFFTPLGNFISDAFESLVEQLQRLPWFALAIIVFAIIARTRRWATAATAAIAMVLPGVFGLWEPTMETLALMLVSLALCVLIGVPLGVWAGLSSRANAFMRPILDAMQTVPGTVYLVPAILFFTIGVVPAAVATVLFALPPIVRLTALGIRGVPPATVEAGRMFGSSRRQLLFKVQLPQAVPSIATGINQTINLGLGIVVIAALVGAGGLGQEALDALRKRAPGRGLVIGLAVLALAIVLDRISRSFMERRPPTAATRNRRWMAVGVTIAVVTAVLVGRSAGWTAFPVDVGVTWADPFDDFLRWVRDTFRSQIAWANDHFVADVYIRITSWLKNDVAWPVIVAAGILLGLWVRGWKLALFCAIGAITIGLTGFWNPAIDTLVQVLLASAIAMMISLPIGLSAGRSRRVNQVISPVLDGLQTIPSITYAIVFVYLIGVSMVPGGIIASVLYAIAPGIRVTALGIRSVPESMIEASTTFGASRRQMMWGVRIPLALPAILLAVNQVLLITVSMVIIAGLSGAGGLGYELVDGFTANRVGKGIEVGLALALMAMVLDRLSQGVAERFQPPAPAH